MTSLLRVNLYPVFLALVVSMVLFMPFMAFAQITGSPEGENPSQSSGNGTGITYDCAKENSNRAPGDCTFQDLLRAVKKATNFGTIIALQLCVVVLAYAGFEYMISGDNPGKRKDANGRLWKVVIGIVVILAAWLIVTLITGVLLEKDVQELVPLG